MVGRSGPAFDLVDLNGAQAAIRACYSRKRLGVA